MNTIELFSGTKSFSKVMADHGHETYTVDNDISLAPDCLCDIRNFTTAFGEWDIIWASPPCQGFSVAAIGKNWNPDRTPKSQRAHDSIACVKETMRCIEEGRPTYWFIENPRGMLRKMEWFEDWVKRMGGVRHTVSYCQYGDTRMKPTDIWTNCLAWQPKPICGPGQKCHEPAPRGSKTGTQGLKGATARGEIPAELFKEILKSIT